MIRDIRKLDDSIKQEYGCILGSLLINLKDIDVFQMEAYYQALAYIQVSKRERKKILDFLLNTQKEENALQARVDTLLKKVKGQERDVLRFTLMEDLVSIIKANHYMSEDKKELIEKFQQQLLITDEQMKVFEGDPSKKSVLPLDDQGSRNKEQIKEQCGKWLSIGIPLTFLYFSRYNAYRHDFKSFALVKLEKKLYPQNTYVSLIKSMILSGVLYKGINWSLNRQKKKHHKLERMLIEESQEIKVLATKYLTEDLNYCKRMLKTSSLREDQKNFVMVMEKTQNFINP